MSGLEGNAYPSEVVVDTSIHIKRLISIVWRNSGHDSVWQHVTPIASTYTLMEFKNSVIGALSYLVDVLQEVATTESNDSARIRLEEIIQLLNMDSRVRERDRRIRIASAYAAQLLSDVRSVAPRPKIKDLVEQIECEAANLEELGFYFYVRDGRPVKMDVLESVCCSLGLHKSPMYGSRTEFTCKRHTLSCKVAALIKTEKWEALLGGYENGELKLKSTRLRDGIREAARARSEFVVEAGKSIGQTLCFPIGDTIIVAKAAEAAYGLITADRDQIALGKYLGLKQVFYDVSANLLIPV